MKYIYQRHIKEKQVEDREILRLLAQDSEKGIRALEDKYGNLIKYIIRGILYQHKEDGEECYQDVLLRCVEKHREYSQTRSSFQTWLTIMVKHIAMDKRKQIERLQNHMTDTMDEVEDMADKRQEVERNFEKEEEYKCMFAAIEKLPRKEKDMFLRKYYYMQSAEQIAAEMGKSKRSVESKLLRIRQKLQSQLEAYRDADMSAGRRG